MSSFNRFERINAKYQNQNTHSPPHQQIEFRRSQVDSSMPFANNLIPSPIGLPFRQQNFTNFMPPLTTIHQQTVQHQEFRRSVSRSRVMTNSRVVVTQNPPIIEKITTSPTVYEIVQPIIEITPSVITEHKVERMISQNPRPIKVVTQQIQHLDMPSPPPLNFRRKGKSKFIKDSCYERYCGCCSWWMWCLLSLLLLGLLIGLGVALFKPHAAANSLIDDSTKKEQNSTKKEQISTKKEQTSQNTTTIVQSKTASEEDKDYIKKIQTILDEGIQEAKQAEKNKNIELENTVHPPYNNSNEANKEVITITNITCPEGYFFYGKKCLSCPNQSVWNGTACIKRVFVQGGGESLGRENKENQGGAVNKTGQSPILYQPQIYVADACSVIHPKKHFLRSAS